MREREELTGPFNVIATLQNIDGKVKMGILAVRAKLRGGSVKVYCLEDYA